jgi:hypothetical protein
MICPRKITIFWRGQSAISMVIFNSCLMFFVCFLYVYQRVIITIMLGLLMVIIYSGLIFGMGMMNRDDQVGDCLFFNIGIILGWWHDDWEDYWADPRDDKIGLLRIGMLLGCPHSWSFLRAPRILTRTMWGPLVISWFISSNNYSYKYHKP